MITFKNDLKTKKQINDESFVSQFDPLINVINDLNKEDGDAFFKKWQKLVKTIASKYPKKSTLKERVSIVAGLLKNDPLSEKRWGGGSCYLWILEINNNQYMISYSNTGFNIDIHESVIGKKSIDDLEVLQNYIEGEL